jgi:2-dehydro-3-deoxyphosphooctonate aldolase (KDO 8-P synthase)
MTDNPPGIINAITGIRHYTSGNFFLMAGPCVVENDEMPFRIAETISRICDRLEIPYIFKASYKKANRTRLDSFTGIGDEKALGIIREVGRQFSIPTVTDIHTEAEAILAADYADVLQIPAFLCRQTDLLVAAARTGKTVNVKKGQFMSAGSMKFVAGKIQQAGNHRVILTERGNSFGYGDLVVDMRNIPMMQAFGVPVVLDVTHSLQRPNQAEGVTGGMPEMIATMAKSGIAAGADGIFIETHPEPSRALSDGANMLRLESLEGLLESLVRIRQAII